MTTKKIFMKYLMIVNNVYFHDLIKRNYLKVAAYSSSFLSNKGDVKGSPG
jgi:hypothetical protein